MRSLENMAREYTISKLTLKRLNFIASFFLFFFIRPHEMINVWLTTTHPKLFLPRNHNPQIEMTFNAPDFSTDQRSLFLANPQCNLPVYRANLPIAARQWQIQAFRHLFHEYGSLRLPIAEPILVFQMFVHSSHTFYKTPLFRSPRFQFDDWPNIRHKWLCILLWAHRRQRLVQMWCKTALRPSPQR